MASTMYCCRNPPDIFIRTNYSPLEFCVQLFLALHTVSGLKPVGSLGNAEVVIENFTVKSDFVQLSYGHLHSEVLIYRGFDQTNIRNVYAVRYCDQSKPMIEPQFCGQLYIRERGRIAVSKIWLPSRSYEVTVIPHISTGYKRFVIKPYSFNVLKTTACARWCFIKSAWRENINFGKYTNVGNGYAMLIVGLPLSTTEFQKACAEYPEHPMKIRFGLLTSFGVNSQVILRNARLRHFILLIPMIRNVAPAVQLGGYIKCPRRKPLPIYGRITHMDHEERDSTFGDTFVRHFLALLVTLPSFESNFDPMRWNVLTLRDVILKNVVLTGLSSFERADNFTRADSTNERIFLKAPMIAQFLELDTEWYYRRFTGRIRIKYRSFGVAFNITYDGYNTWTDNYLTYGFIGMHTVVSMTGDFEVPSRYSGDAAAYITQDYGHELTVYSEELRNRIKAILLGHANTILKQINLPVYLETYEFNKTLG
ncbi:uncharacterized protein LOC111263181 [Varroa jacobsoni]|uniref:uncharacterized protein LOC111263181 n=1 Tax=Varroa jacobsoni TaxID=62625 RepID=UPI000BF9CF2E|nr:uncharacterized protein LOC111263181 [Varroa jacobsoni]